MPLNKGAINEILQFAAEGLVEAGDVLSLEEYKNHPMRLRGHMVGLSLRELQNRMGRQTTHMASGTAQFLANRHEPGIRDDGDLDKIEEAWLRVITALIQEYMPDTPDKYDLCEFYYFRHPTLKPGFQAAQGGLLANAATLYPEAWAYLKTVEGQMLCKTESEWQALTTATWATLADGTKVGWNGIGGAPFFAPNTATGALRLPDLRGMYAEAAGFDSLGVGGVHGDAGRDIVGTFGLISPRSMDQSFGSGAFLPPTQVSGYTMGTAGSTVPTASVSFSASRVVPTAVKNQPRAWGSLACVYLGRPAS